MKTLIAILQEKSLNISTNPKGTDKGDRKSYVHGFYEAEFAKRQAQKNRIFEIGVRTGASLALWANYFAQAEIIGADIEAAGTPAGPVREYLDYSNVKFQCKNAYDSKFAAELTGEFNIMIDDGPHSLESQKTFIRLYLAKLEKHGVMIIEDVQRGYRDSSQLQKCLPAGGKYCFETYDFRKRTNTGDDFIFVVRHNVDNQKLAGKILRLRLRSAMAWMAVPHRRLFSYLSRAFRCAH